MIRTNILVGKAIPITCLVTVTRGEIEEALVWQHERQGAEMQSAVPR